MKKVIFGLAFSLLAVVAFAKTPPQAVLTAFQKQFPNMTDVDWSQEKNGEWEAEFHLNHVETSANFSADGRWLETETEIKFSDLPEAVRMVLKGKKVKEASKIQRADGSMVYEAEVKRKDLLFDSTGKRLN